VLPKLKNRVYFEISSFEILKEYDILLDDIYKVLEKHNSYKIRVTGYTDIQGNNIFNKNLSLKRANAVKNELIKRGINNNSIIISFVATPPNDIIDILKDKNLSRCVAFEWEKKDSD
jgi:outer membrane protein OmpA-like peptidoglycan-associated protein